MACSTSNSPVDISPANLVAGPDSEYSVCAEKCAYRYDYPDSTCNVTNEGEYLKIRYTRGNSAPVHYNSFALEVEELRLYTPSLHTYDGQHAAAELVIVHRGAGQALLACIPIVTSTSSVVLTASSRPPTVAPAGRAPSTRHRRRPDHPASTSRVAAARL